MSDAAHLTDGALAALYKSKVTTADAAMSSVIDGQTLAMGMAISEPPALLTALAAHVDFAKLKQIQLWYFHSLITAGSTVLRYEMIDRIRPHCMFLTAIERELIKREGEDPTRSIAFVPTAFSESPRLFTDYVDLDVFVTAVSPMDAHGWFTFGTGNDYSTTAARTAKRLVVEVNRNMPRVFGESLLHVSEIDAIVENDAPLIELAFPPASPAQEVIAKTVAAMIGDGACLQMGIGTLPNAVCALLADRKDLGIHTELLTPAMAKLVDCGAVTNTRKVTYKGRSVFTFAMGDRGFYDFLHDNPSLHSAPVQVVNDPRHIAKNPNVVSVNATLQVDLSGACNSEHVLGRQFSGAGGQLDFVRGARASPGGKSIIACESTAKNGTLSRIVRALDGPVTVPRNDTQIVVTEYGAADLRGLSLAARKTALIGLAHPKFRAALGAGGS